MPSYLRTTLIVSGWVVLSLWTLATTGLVWTGLTIMPGIFIVIAFATMLTDADRQRLARRKGPTTRYGGNVFGNGSTFYGYTDPKTGKLVAPDKIDDL